MGKLATFGPITSHAHRILLQASQYCPPASYVHASQLSDACVKSSFKHVNVGQDCMVARMRRANEAKAPKALKKRATAIEDPTEPEEDVASNQKSGPSRLGEANEAGQKQHLRLEKGEEAVRGNLRPRPLGGDWRREQFAAMHWCSRIDSS